MKEQTGGAERILAEYDAKFALHESFRATCESLIRQLLKTSSLRVHSVTSRVKERPHLAEKLSRLGKSYASLSDITDVIGLRVITHFEDDVDRIAEVVEREFEIDLDKSIDKRKALDPDRFGYISLHYICSMREERAALAEYREFAGVWCEVQIRSILQHTWAEIEHDLGYKAGAPIPAPIRRRFSRLAGLLEIADREFTVIRDDLAEYTKQVTAEIQHRPDLVGVDDISVRAFIDADSVSKYLDREMAAHSGAALDLELFPRIAEMIEFAGIQTIEDLGQALRSQKDFILHQYKFRVPKGKYPTLMLGVGIFHLVEVLIAERGDPLEMEKLFHKFEIATVDDRASAAKGVIDKIQAAKKLYKAKKNQ